MPATKTPALMTFGRATALVQWVESSTVYPGGTGNGITTYTPVAKSRATAARIFSRTGTELGLVSLPIGCTKYGAHALGQNGGAPYSTFEAAVRHFV